MGAAYLGGSEVLEHGHQLFCALVEVTTSPVRQFVVDLPAMMSLEQMGYQTLFGIEAYRLVFLLRG